MIRKGNLVFVDYNDPDLLVHIQNHLLKIDSDCAKHIDQEYKNNNVSDSDFTINEKGEKLFKLNDPETNDEIIFNYTLRKVHTYNGVLNTKT
jgi:hypothetical protein